MGTKPPPPRAIAMAIAFVLSCFGFTLFTWIQFGGKTPLQPKGYRFHALLGLDAVNLTNNASVRISGVEVGKVVTTKAREGRVDAEINVFPKYVPIPRDSRIIVRQKTLIGETFLELTPGDRNGPQVPDGGTLPASHTQRSVSIDELLGEFDAPTRRDFKRGLNDFADAFAGRGPDLNAFLGNLGPGMDSITRVMTVLDRQRPALERVISDAGVVFRAMSARSDQLQSLVSAGDQVFTTTAARNRELTATIRELPLFLRALRGSLGRLEQTASSAGPTVRALRPVAPLLRPGLEGIDRLAPELEAVFRSLRPVTRASRLGLPALTRLVDAVRPLIAVLDPAGAELVPVVDLLAAYASEQVSSWANLANTTGWSFTGRSGQEVHTLRVQPMFTNDGLLGASRRFGSSRYNPYLAPGGLAKLADGGLESFTCGHQSNPTPAPPSGTGVPPCKQQAPWTFRGATRSYPRAVPAR